MSTRLTADDATLAAQFAALKTLDDIAFLLDVTDRELRFYLYKAKSYTSFTIKKRSGGDRTISAPDNALKIIQSKLSQVLHAVYRGRSPVHGFVRSRSIVTNATQHLGCLLLLNLDLKDFFPTIHFGRVRGLFTSKPYNLPLEAAMVLAQICCNEKILPAGAPTSPIVSNLVCARLDTQLKALAKQFGCFYTRYADDITFSTRRDRFAPQITYQDAGSRKWIIGEELSKVITGNDFQVNISKTRVCGRRSRQEVTGLVINDGLNVRRLIIRQVRAMLHAWAKFGVAAAQSEFEAKFDRKQRKAAKVDFKLVVRGKLDFIGQVRGRDDELFLSMLEKYARLPDAGIIKTISITKEASNKALGRAVWLLETDAAGAIGTAFSLEGFGLFTASHVLDAAGGNTIYASRPHVVPGLRYVVKRLRYSEDVDLAELNITGFTPLQFKQGLADRLTTGQDVTLLGFPDYHVGDSVHLSRGPIVQERKYFGVQHFIIQPIIVKGNSGGPLLNADNRVIGIAVKGVDTPGKFSKVDQLSSFIPISILNDAKVVWKT